MGVPGAGSRSAGNRTTSRSTATRPSRYARNALCGRDRPTPSSSSLVASATTRREPAQCGRRRPAGSRGLDAPERTCDPPPPVSRYLPSRHEDARHEAADAWPATHLEIVRRLRASREQPTGQELERRVHHPGRCRGPGGPTSLRPPGMVRFAFTGCQDWCVRAGGQRRGRSTLPTVREHLFQVAANGCQIGQSLGRPPANQARVCTRSRCWGSACPRASAQPTLGLVFLPRIPQAHRAVVQGTRPGPRAAAWLQTPVGSAAGPPA